MERQQAHRPPDRRIASSPSSALIAAAAGVTGIVADQWKRDASGYFSCQRPPLRDRHARDREREGSRSAATSRPGSPATSAWAISSSKPVFVGIAPKKTVDAYLARVAHDEATGLDLDPFRVTYVHHPGTQAPGRPAGRLFWAASSTGKPLTWKMRSGDWSVVVMNARRLARGLGLDRRRREGACAPLGGDRADARRARAARRRRRDARLAVAVSAAHVDGHRRSRGLRLRGRLRVDEDRGERGGSRPRRRLARQRPPRRRPATSGRSSRGRTTKWWNGAPREREADERELDEQQLPVARPTRGRGRAGKPLERQVDPGGDDERDERPGELREAPERRAAAARASPPDDERRARAAPPIQSVAAERCTQSASDGQRAAVVGLVAREREPRAEPEREHERRPEQPPPLGQPGEEEQRGDEREPELHRDERLAEARVVRERRQVAVEEADVNGSWSASWARSRKATIPTSSARDHADAGEQVEPPLGLGRQRRRAGRAAGSRARRRAARGRGSTASGRRARAVVGPEAPEASVERAAPSSARRT